MELTRQRQAIDLYLDLMKRCLTRHLFIDEEARDFMVSTEPWIEEQPWGPHRRWRRQAWAPLGAALRRRGLRLVRTGGDPETRANGHDWPLTAETMIGLRGLDELEQCVRTALDEAVPGDFAETGVWRGGAAIFMRAVLAAYGDTERVVWAADSFQGLPTPDVDRYPADADLDLSEWDRLAVGLDEVKAAFARYELLDEQVRFLVGWFRDTLPTAPIEQLALLRLDGDYYESTMDSLTALYPKLSPGGFVIVDDYGIPACAKAVTDYRTAHGIDDELQRTPTGRAFWRRGA